MDIATLFVRFKADSSPVKQEMAELESTAVKRAGNVASTLMHALGDGQIQTATVHRFADYDNDLAVMRSRTDLAEWALPGSPAAGDTAA